MGSGASSASAAIEAATNDELKACLEALPADVLQKMKSALKPAVTSFRPDVFESASELLSQLREKKISCKDLVDKSLARIEATKELNACVQIYADEARSKAKAVDDKISSGSGELGVLEGLPIVAKINFDMAGTVSDASNPAFKGFVPNTSSPVIQALLDAGAIVIAKTNMPEMARNMNPFSPIYGKAFNPVNLACTPAGSSTGTAAAIGAGIVATGLGSDTGGSTRVPAICCGVTGFRPSPGRYSNDGCIPCVPTADTPGPLGTCVGDIMLMDTAITGTKHPYADAASAMGKLTGLKIALPLDWIAADKFANKTVGVSWEVSTGALADKGVEFVKEDIGNDGELFKSIACFMKSGWEGLESYLERQRKAGVKHEVLDLSTKDLVAKFPKGEDTTFRPPDEDAEKAKAANEQYEAGVRAADEFISGYFAKTAASFMLTPAMKGLPPNTEKAQFDGHATVTGFRTVAENMSDEEAPGGLGDGLLTRYAPRWASLLASIAIPTPIKCQATGLHTGVILWGPKDSDAELLQVAAAVESVFAGVDVSKHLVSF